MNSNPTKKGWSLIEDSNLHDLVVEDVANNLRWVDIASVLSSHTGKIRTGKQCRERWQHQLNPTILKDDFTIQQKKYLYQLQEVYGNKWALIAQHMPGRTDNAVKNYFYSSIRRMIKRVNDYLSRQKKRKQFKNIGRFQTEFCSKLTAVVDGNYNNLIMITNSKIRALSKQILTKMVELLTEVQTTIQQGIIDERWDVLISMMSQFRRNCKKRKQKRRVIDQFQQKEQCQIYGNSIQKQFCLIESCFQQVILRQGEMKIQIQSLMQKQHKMKNEGDQIINVEITEQKLSFKSNCKIQFQDAIHSVSNHEFQGIVLEKEELVVEPSGNFLFLKDDSLIKQQSKVVFQDTFNPISTINLVLGRKRSEIVEDDWSGRDQSKYFALFKSEDSLGANEVYESIGMVTEMKMLEVSLALEQLQLNSNQLSKIQCGKVTADSQC